jgi:hypothetical protein
MSNITKTCLYQSCTIPSINFVPNHASTIHQHLYKTMHKPCTITYTICLNHQPCTSTPYQVLVMYHTMYQTCTSTPYKVLVMYHTMYQPCTSTLYHITQSFHTPCTIGYIKQVPSMVYLKKVPNNQDHIPSICLDHAPNMCLNHVLMPQQYTKDLPQACTIKSSTCNPKNIHINIHVTL